MKLAPLHAERGATSTYCCFLMNNRLHREQSTEKTNFTVLPHSFLIENRELWEGPEKCRCDGVHHNVCYLELNLSAAWQWTNSPLPLSPVNCDEMCGACFPGHLGEMNEMFFFFCWRVEADSVGWDIRKVGCTMLDLCSCDPFIDLEEFIWIQDMTANSCFCVV